MSNKIFITANQLLEDSFELGMQILESGFVPTFLVGVWRGGAPIGIAVQEVLEECGVATNHIAVRTSSYTGINQRSQRVSIHGLGYLVDTLTPEDRVLIVDDVHDSGLSVAELMSQIQLRCVANMPAEVRLATVYYKPSQSLVPSKPDFYLHETDDWLVFPHELAGLSAAEIEQHKPGVSGIKKRLLARINGRPRGSVGR